MKMLWHSALYVKEVLLHLIHTMVCRVYQSKQHEPLSLGHMTRCLVGTGMQALNCWLAAKVLIRAFKSWSPGVMYLAKRFPALQVTYPLSPLLLFYFIYVYNYIYIYICFFSHDKPVVQGITRLLPATPAEAKAYPLMGHQLL